MSTHHPPELDSATCAADSVASSPRSEHHHQQPYEPHPRVRFMCSFGGKILPRPHDNQLRYVGGDTRIVAVNRATTFSALLHKLSKLSGCAITNITVKYQLPNEDLDSLISVTTDEDVENMMEEYDRLAHNQNPRSARLRLFLFDKGEDSRASSISSLLEGSANREQWFLDALNGGDPLLTSGLERGRSEASSIVSEVPDYLFGLENSEDNPVRDSKLKGRIIAHDNVSVSDPGSPAPVVSSPFCSTSSAPNVSSMPDLPPVKTKPDSKPVQKVESKETAATETYVETGETIITQPGGYAGHPTWHYTQNPNSPFPGPPAQPVPVYYVPGPVQQPNVPVQPVPIRAAYVQQYPAAPGQIPVGYHQAVPGAARMYGGVLRAPAPAVDPGRVVPEMVAQPVYYGVSTTGAVPYPGMVVPGGEDMALVGQDPKPGRRGSYQ